MITDETLFRQMLSIERRRSERSGTRFALLLLDLQELTADATAPLEVVESAVSSAMRETDITGWYARNTTLGVILTALKSGERRVLEPIVMQRVRTALAAHLSESQLERIWVSCHVFPEEPGSDGDDSEMERLLGASAENASAGKRRSIMAKRAFDILCSLTALIVGSWLFLLIAVLIKVTSRGPALFRQKRIGQYGKEFNFLKFRSMVVNNDSKIHQEYVRNLIANKVDAKSGSFKIANDPRVTAVGRIIRKTSLDELPQFINVLRGEMSLVGPRPPIPYELEGYSLWHRRRILEAKPGITGAWQVEGRSRTSFDDMVRMDLRYIRNQSFWLDLKILLKTPRAVIGGNGAF